MTKTHPGLYVGGSHASGSDIPVKILDKGKVIDKVRVEGHEYHLCSDSVDNKEFLDFKQKKNIDVLTYIFNNSSCEFHQGSAEPGDFIIRKSAVLDSKLYDRHGTAKSIINQIQTEHDGRTTENKKEMLNEGGKINVPKYSVYREDEEKAEEIKKEADIHKDTFEKIKQGDINTPTELGEALVEDHDKQEKQAVVGDFNSAGGEIEPPKPLTPAQEKTKQSKKLDAVHTLSENMRSLKINVSKGLKSENEKERLTALAVALMLRTYERVGNADSAKDGHFGITGLRKKHVKVIGDLISLDYVGKSGVDHDKQFTDSVIAGNLKLAIKNSPSREIFVTSEGFKINAPKINRFLYQFGITAKDIRGFSSNKLVLDKLKEKPIPKEESERKKEFLSILKSVCKKIGHGRATLRNHYLIPDIEKDYIERGKIYDIKKYEEGGMIEYAKGGLITDRIQTFEDACRVLGVTDEEPTITGGISKNNSFLIAAYKLAIIAEALNEGWEPDWNNGREYKYYPYFNMQSDFSLIGVNHPSTGTSTPGRLVFKTEDVAKYAATQFLELYKEYFTKYQAENAEHYKLLEKGGQMEGFATQYLTEQFYSAGIKELPSQKEIEALSDIIEKVKKENNVSQDEAIFSESVWEYVETLILSHGGKDYKYFGVKVDGSLIYAQRFLEEQVVAGGFISKVLALAGQKEGEVVEITKAEYENFSIIDTEKKDLYTLDKYISFNPGAILFQDDKRIIARSVPYDGNMTNLPFKLYNSATKDLLGIVEIDNFDVDNISLFPYVVIKEIKINDYFCEVFDAIMSNLPETKKGIALPETSYTDLIADHFNGKIITKYNKYTLING